MAIGKRGSGPPARLATAAIVVIAVCWGSMFFIVHDLVDRVPVMDLLTIRYAIAAAVLVSLAPKAAFRLSRLAWKRAAMLGVLSAMALACQAFGLAHTTASSAGFITGLYVVLTPLFAAAFLKERIERAIWLAVVLAAAGLAVLSPDGIHLGPGELFSLGGAAAFAVQVMLLSRWSTAEEALGLTIVQCITILVVCAAFAAPNGLTAPNTTDDWIGTIYTAVVVGGFALLAQTWAQAHVPATRAAIIMGSEPAFAALFAVALGGEAVTERMLVGGGLLLLATAVVLIPSRKGPDVELALTADPAIAAFVQPTLCSERDADPTDRQSPERSGRRKIF